MNSNQLFAILVVALLLAASIGFYVYRQMQSDSGRIVSDGSFEAVDSFRRDAHFIAQDYQLHVLRTSTSEGPKPIFTIHEKKHGRNSRIGVSRDGESVFVTDGTTVFRVARTGEAEPIARLRELQFHGIEAAIEERFRINWFLSPGNSDDVLYFVLLTRHDVESSERKSYVCRANLLAKDVQSIEIFFPAGIDIDLKRGIVYAPPRANRKAGLVKDDPKIVVKDFDGEVDRQLAVSHNFSHCTLSDDGETVLLSSSALDRQPTLSLLHVASGKESILPFAGSCATWGADNLVIFVRGENTLWQFALGDEEPIQLFEVVGKPTTERGSFATPPVLSRDKSWLSWGWGIKTGDRVRLGTILVDLHNREYRTVDGWWHNVNWTR